jgi:hypothetical protein
MSMNVIISPYPAGAGGFSPLSVSGLDWWLRGRTASINGTPEFDAPDSSPANLDYGQNTAANEPTLIVGPDGHQLIRFGSGKFLVADPTARSFAVANTMMVICTKSSAADYIFSGSEAGAHGSPSFISGFNPGVADIEYYNDFGGGNIERATFVASADTNLHILICTRTDDTGNAVGYFDGGSPAFTVAVNNNCDWNGLVLSRVGRQFGASSSNYTGDLAEILHWPNVVSKADLNLLGPYFASEYPSITWTTIP